MNNPYTNPETEAAQDAQLRQLLQSQLLVDSPSEALQQRVARLASTSHPVAAPSRPTRSARSPKWRLAASMALCSSLVVAGSIIWPHVLSTPAMARVDLKQVDAALGHVATVHCVRYRIEGTKRTKEGEMWFDNGKWRVESAGGGSITIFVSGTSWIYDKAQNTVTIEKNSKGPFFRNPTGFTLSNVVQDFGNPGSKTNLTQQGTTTIDGRTFKRALLENSNDYETSKISLLVDAETDLPQSLDMNVRNNRGKEGQWTMVFSYNQPLSPQLFKPDFGPSVRVVNRPQRAAESKPLTKEIAHKQVGDTTIIIRSLEVNPHGSVFLNYSVDGNSKVSADEWVCFLGDAQTAQYHIIPLSSQENEQSLNGAGFRSELAATHTPNSIQPPSSRSSTRSVVRLGFFQFGRVLSSRKSDYHSYRPASHTATLSRFVGNTSCRTRASGSKPNQRAVEIGPSVYKARLRSKAGFVLHPQLF